MVRTLFWLLAFFALSSASAQADALPSLDPSRLGADIFALGGVVLLVVQFIKRQVERPRKLPDGSSSLFKPAPWVWWGLSVGLSELAAAGLFYAKFGATFGTLPAPWGWLLYGLLAGLAAAGFKDLVMGVVKGPPALPDSPLPEPSASRPASATPTPAPRSGLEDIR